MARKTARAPRRREAKIAFDAITIEGALLQPDLITRIAAADPTPQLAAEYGLDPGEKLREVVQTKFMLAQSLHTRFQASDRGPAALTRFLTNLFAQVFEFTDLVEAAPVRSDGRTFPIGRQALDGCVPIVFAPWEAVDNGAKEFGEDGRQRAPAQLLQEYLNAEDKALWGLVCDGRVLRLYRDNAAMTRPAYIEADLTMLFDAAAPRLADFSALWLLIHVSRFGKPGALPTDCALERWREDGRERGARARDDLRGGVERALALLGQGFLAHPANARLREELARGALSPRGCLDALLRLVYRLIFVFAAEDRDLLHLPQPSDAGEFERWRSARDLYKKGYALDRVRQLSAKRPVWDRNCDGWEGTKILFRELWRGQTSLALPALGGLFAPGQVRDFSDCQVANQFFYAAIFHLAWLRTTSGLERVNWRDMETEELGSVYESLLELSPTLADPSGFAFIEVAGHERKTTASYYTPDSLVQALLDQTLDPLITERVKGKDGKHAIDALLDLRIIDPACGSGHFLLAAARRLAVKCAQLAKPTEAPSPADYRHWLREVARRCLFGVDKNPMAVELAKAALWIETVEPGKPLSFLDAHLRCGDALLGVYDLGALNQGIPDEAYKRLTNDDNKAATEWRKRNKAERDARTQGQFLLFEPPRELLEAARALEAEHEDALAEVEAKAEIFRALMAGPARTRMEAACDLYSAAFLLPKLEPPMRKAGEASTFIPTSRDVWDKLEGRRPHELLEREAVSVAKAARIFHWPLEFPQVFFPGTGRKPGFDLALGNPPWERIKLQEQEFFASRDPEIAQAPNKAARQKLIDALAEAPEGSAKRMLHAEFNAAKRIAEAASVFARMPSEVGGRYPLTGTGDVNTYALFAELFTAASRRAGIIVPRGIATDATTARFFGDLVTSGRLDALYCFENEAFIFRAVHHSFQFAILAIRPPSKAPMRFMQFIRRLDQISEPDRDYVLSAADIAAINPNTRTAPIFRAKADAELTRQIYARVPVLIEESKDNDGNPWGIEFITMFHMANDSNLFRTTRQLSSASFKRDGRGWVRENGSDRYAPLYEGKMFDFFDHRAAGYSGRADDRGFRVLPETTLTEHEDPTFEVEPFYWVPDGSLAQVLGDSISYFIAFSKVTGIGNERTFKTYLIPRGGIGDSANAILANCDANHLAALYAILASITLDYIARLKVGGVNINFFHVKQFAVPAPSAISSADLAFIVPRVLELTYTSHSMKPFADELGHKGSAPFPWNEERRALLRAELDAKVARLYGLTRDQLRYILHPADVYGTDYPSETFRVLQKNERDRYGEYRTRRLVLDAWDQMERGELR